MSVQDVRAFWQKVKQEPALHKQLQEIKSARGTALATVVRIAAKEGFSFTAQDYETTVKEELARQHAAGELSDAQLEQVAGGAFLASPPTNTGNNCSAGCLGVIK